MNQDTKYDLLDDIELDFHALLAFDERHGELVGLPIHVEFLMRHGYARREDRPMGVTSSGGHAPNVDWAIQYVLTEKGRKVAFLLQGSGAEHIVAIREILDSLDKDDNEKPEI